MSELYYELYLESLENIKKLKKELAPLLEPLDAQIDELNKKINDTEKELKEIKSQQKLCGKKITDIKNNHTKDILAYMQEKIRNERTGQKQIVQIDDDSEIIAIHKRKDDMLQEQEEMLKKYDEQAEAKKGVVSQIKSELEPILKKRDRVAKPLKKEEDSSDTWLWAYKRDLEKEVEETPFDSKDFTDTPSSCSSSYSSSSSSYDQDRYASEQAEALRKQTDYARQQAEEARKQTELARRQTEESKRQAEKANREASERRLEEERRRRQQEEAERREIQRQKDEALRRERNRMYHGVIYFKNGTKRNSSPSNDRRLAEMSAQRMYDQAMRTAISDHFKPTRYEVVED